MTVGSIVSDTREPIASPAGPALAGQLFSRSGSGADWPIQSVTVPSYRYVSVPVGRGRHRRYETRRVDIERTFKRRVKSNAEHSYSLNESNYMTSEVIRLADNARYSSAQLYNLTYPVPGNSLPANKRIDLINKLNAQVASSEFDASVTLATADQTIGMIVGAVRRIDKSILLARRGKLSRALDTLVNGDVNPALQVMRKRTKLRGSPRALRAALYGEVRAHERLLAKRSSLNKLSALERDRVIREFSLAAANREQFTIIARRLLSEGAASNWLALQYGLLPALDDIDQGMKYLAYEAEAPYEKIYKARVVADTSYDVKVGSNTGAPIVRIKRVVQVSLRAYFSRPPVKSQYLNLGDVPSAAWERLPWSFVADWFFPVGDYLAALTASQRLSAATVWESTLTQYDHTVPAGNYTFIGWPCKLTLGIWSRGTVFTRKPAALTVPLPEFKGWDRSLSVGHLVNSVALLVSRFK